MEVMFDSLILSSFHYPSRPSQEEIFRVLYCNHITDVRYLFNLLGMSDLEVFKVIYLEISPLIKVKKSQY
jgi:hypothetical protein